MKKLVKCNICPKQGDGVWAGFHRKTYGHNDFTILYGEEDEPPSKLQSSQRSHDNNRQSFGIASVVIGTKLRQRFLSGAFCSLRPTQ